MRRLIKVLLVMLVIAASVTVSYASTIENGGELELQYIGVSNHTESLVKGLGMKAIFSATIVPKNESVLDKVVITAKVRNYMSDSIVYQSTMTTYYDNLKNEFKCQGDCTVPSVGHYYLDVTYKCYKNGTLLETITGQTESVYI